MDDPRNNFMDEAVRLARHGMNNNCGGPFGAVVVKNGQIISRGNNEVSSTNDPTAHAEVVAIRKACKVLDSFQLEGCVIYTSCEPCPMCLGAIYWARPDKVYYACDRHDAADINFDDQFIYDEINTPMSERKIQFISLPKASALQVFKEWELKEDKTVY